MKAADLYRLFELASEFSATEFVRDYDAEYGDGMHQTLRAEAHDVGQMAARAIEAQAGQDAHDALQVETAPAPQQVIWCTFCFIEGKQSALAGKEPLPMLPGIVMATVSNGGAPSTVLLCEQRHPLGVAPPSLLIAQPGQVPPVNGFGH